jgi:hypothetical protein
MELSDIYQMVYHLDCPNLVINHDKLVNVNDRFFIEVENNKSLDLVLVFTGGDIIFSLIVDLKYNSKFNLKLFSSTQSKINIVINHLNDKGISNVKEIGISKSNEIIEFNTNAIIKNETFDNSTNEELIGVVLDSGSVIANPILTIDTDSCAAHHSSVIGYLDKNMIYYMMSRGISEVSAKSMIIDSYKAQILENHI